MTTKITEKNISALSNQGLNWEVIDNTDSPVSATGGSGYFCNTTSGAITINLPASPSVGDTVAIIDAYGQFGSNAVTVSRNGSNIEGNASDTVLNQESTKITFVYSDATKGWIPINDETLSPAYVTATGGTVSTSGDYKIHTFTSSGCFVVSCAGNSNGNTIVDYLVVAGGGSGGNGYVNNNCGSGGGGAGGFRESVPSPAAWSASPLANSGGGLTLSVQTYPVTVGAGGAAAGPGDNSPSAPGSNSAFSTITSAGGGYGANASPAPPSPAYPGIPGKTVDEGGNGGSGGGGARTSGPTSGGTGNTPPVSPPQGSPGGTGSPAAGGGGATAAGTGGVDCSSVGNGGAGATTSISGSPTAYAGGGGAGKTAGENAGASGGTGGGGNGGDHYICGPNPTQGNSGTANTGGGGGGQGASGGAGSTSSGAGGSGIVILRYKFQN